MMRGLLAARPSGLAATLVVAVTLAGLTLGMTSATTLALADGPPTRPAPLTLTLKGNRSVRGTVESLERDRLWLTTTRGRQAVQVADISTTSARQVADLLERRLARQSKQADAPKTGQAWIDLGDLCLRHAFYDRARKAYRRGGQAEDTFVIRTLSTRGVEEADRLEARDLYQLGVDFQQRGKRREAEKALRDLLDRFPSSSYAASAQRLIELLAAKQDPDAGKGGKDGDEQRPGAKKPGEKKPGEKKPVKQPPRSRDPYVRALDKLMQQIEALRQAGLTEQGDGKHHKAVKLFRQAMEQIDQLEGLLDKARQVKRPEVTERAAALTEALPPLRVRFHLLLGHAYAMTNQLRHATYHVNQVLIVDQENEQALELRDKITAEKMKRLRRN